MHTPVQGGFLPTTILLIVRRGRTTNHILHCQGNIGQRVGFQLGYRNHERAHDNLGQQELTKDASLRVAEAHQGGGVEIDKFNSLPDRKFIITVQGKDLRGFKKGIAAAFGNNNLGGSMATQPDNQSFNQGQRRGHRRRTGIDQVGFEENP